MKDKNAYCGYCGTLYEIDSWPRVCSNCGELTWRNPLPIVVAVLKVYTYARVGLIAKRGIAPNIGEWALPGGHLEYGETWQEGLAREVFEETNILISPENFNLVDVLSADSNKNVLIFGSAWISEQKIDLSFKNEETLDIALAEPPVELAFPTHTLVFNNFFK
jgi:8-oxo-dGTP diphosphatase